MGANEQFIYKGYPKIKIKIMGQSKWPIATKNKLRCITSNLIN